MTADLLDPPIQIRLAHDLETKASGMRCKWALNAISSALWTNNVHDCCYGLIIVITC